MVLAKNIQEETQTMFDMQRLCVATILAGLVLPASLAEADDVKLSGFWINDVNVVSMDDLQMTYMTARGDEVTKPVLTLEGMKLDNYPELGKAVELIEDDKAKDAVRPLSALVDRAQEDWVRDYGRRLLVPSAVAAENHRLAVKTYIDLIKSRTDQWWLDDPPLESLAALPDDERLKFGAEAQKAAAKLKGKTAEVVQPFVHAAVASQQELQQVVADNAMPEVSAVVLPKGVGEGELVEELMRGKFEDALKIAEMQVLSSGQMARKLYLKGIAQLNIAEKTDDEKMYKSAGLSFMKVIIFFGRNQGRYVGPSMVEAAHVHNKIGRPDIAQSLFERAINLIDEEEDPAYFQRMNKLQSGG